MACAFLLGCTNGEGIPQPVPPAPSVAAAAPAATPPVANTLQSYDGLYVGTAVSMRQGPVGCPAELTLRNFRVERGAVRFGGFRGPIQRDGSVQIPNRTVWLTGRFNGTEFRGEFRQYIGANPRSGSAFDTCLYVTVLQRQPA